MTREQYIKNLIKEQGYDNIKSFCEKIGVKYSTLLSGLSTSIGGMAVDTVIKICKGLNITVEELENCGKPSQGLTLSEHERELVVAYRQQPSMQGAVDRLLGLEPSAADEKKQA